MRIYGSVCVLVGLLILIGLVVWRRRSAQGLIAGASDAGSANSAAGAAAGSAAVGAPGVAIAAAGAEGRATAGGVGVGEGPAVRVRAGWRARAPLAAAITRHPLSAQGFRDDGSPEEEYPGDAVPGNGHDSGHLDGNYRGHGDAQGNGGAEPEGTGDSAADPSDLQVALPDWPVESLGWTSDASESAYDLLVRGTELLRDRHNAQAAVVLERASRLEQGKGSILEALGRAYFNSGQHARAAETFEALLEVDPSAHYGHFALGMSFARLGRAQEAKTHLRLAVALQPTSETYRRALDRLLATDP
jgi:tetratricopeptide (TPR) repeat protein